MAPNKLKIQGQIDTWEKILSKTKDENEKAEIQGKIDALKQQLEKPQKSQKKPFSLINEISGLDMDSEPDPEVVKHRGKVNDDFFNDVEY